MSPRPVDRSPPKVQSQKRYQSGQTDMPSTRSPLSPKMDSLTMPSQASRRPHGTRQLSVGSPGALRLPSLPRFHPANFASQNSSTTATPSTNPNSPQAPLSPRRQYHAQMQFQMYQSSLKPRGPGAKPTSPRLIPMGSPGPVTPLELAGDGTDGGYLTAGVRTNDTSSHVDKLIREEAIRRGEISPGRTTSVGGR
ncbi:hypothetical protein BU24DRAFT_225162 [Aaosphaeria arxii CBS 175.79]|uniref:Uncharacterized protein n=1 Tax=Aaosphaeria arxii CBS 175.79 TaxID=1450172 RepID=A0A6A5XQA5_9PLEO|nr:uncharacterized protein BU24DRAFT_225162 [Aaosphaeria arxii CBS 175.79]KAF2014941.1 hypothetical protein BU24DRAFT_225162 [Aaosphaeria arxii CBS 175.79]